MEIAKRLDSSFHTEGSLPAPYQLQLHLTDFCNLRCIFCPTRTFVEQKNLDQQKELSTEEWMHLIDEAAGMGVQEFHICGGGEPFFFKEKALAVMSRIKEHSKRGEIITNGSLISKSALSRIVSMGFDKIIFSLDAPGAGVHDLIRGKACHKKIVETISAFDREKKALGCENPQLNVHFVACSHNYRLLPEMVRLCGRIGVDTLLIQALNIWSEEIKRYQLTVEQTEELRELLFISQSLAEDAGISTNFEEFLSNDLFSSANNMEKTMIAHAARGNHSHIPCFLPWYNISVFADGRVLPCFILREEAPSVKEQSLADIWKGKRFESIRSRMKNNSLSEDCRRCNPWSLKKNDEIRASLGHQKE